MQKYQALEDLSRRLSMKCDPSDQDWEITNADSERVREFIEFYQSEDLEQSARIMMVLLIIYSLEKTMGQQTKTQEPDSTKNWCQLVNILRERQEEYTFIIDHHLSRREWALEEELAQYHPLLPLFEQEFGGIIHKK